jgi:hypothetical protein
VSDVHENWFTWDMPWLIHYRKKASVRQFFMFVGADVHTSNYVHRFKNRYT